MSEKESGSDHQNILPGMRSLSKIKKPKSMDDLYTEGANSKHELERKIEDYVNAAADAHNSEIASRGSLLKDMLDISSDLTDGASSVIDDSFLRCFTSMPPDHWNWNWYLFPLWFVGVLLRHCILFPLRLLVLMGGFAFFFPVFFGIRLAMKDTPKRRRIERALLVFQCGMMVASWTGVIKFHGPRPVPAPNRVWVANHTSLIDYMVLCSHSPFASIMQLQPGWVGFMQKSVLGCLGCLWFNRTEVSDRKIVHKKMKEHISRSDCIPLVIFPEGTCVNNEYCVMFKKGAFDLEATVCPIAIKYNKSFVDAFWNSKRQSFTLYMLKLMTSWALVCDIYFLEPQTKQPNEDTTEFASRVQRMIAERAQLQIVPWDGYLKYYNLGQKNPHLIERRRQAFSNLLKTYLDEPEEGVHLSG